MATKSEQEALDHAEEIGAKTDGEARAKVAADENAAATARSAAAAKGAKTSNIEQALKSLGMTLHQVKSYREDSGMAIVESIDGGPAKRVEIATMYGPQVERALERLGIDKADIKAAPGASPTSIEIPVRGVKKGDPRFANQPGVTIPQDGMIAIDRKWLAENDDPNQKPKVRKAGEPVSQDLEGAAITKLGLKRSDVKAVKRDGEEMVVTLHSGDVKRVRIGTL